MLPQPRRVLPAFFARHTAALRGRRFFFLFLFLLGSIAVYPYAENAGPLYYLFRFLTSLIILLTVYAIKVRHTFVLFLLILAIPAIVNRVMFHPADQSVLALTARFLSLAFDLTVIAIIFRRVYARGTPNTETIFAALCIYLLLGFAFASVYALIGSGHPTAFHLDPVLNAHTTPDRFDFVYYSFGTMTELGSPGIAPVSPVARSVSIVEAILGILYLAVLISRLLSTYGTVTATPREDKSGLP